MRISICLGLGLAVSVVGLQAGPFEKAPVPPPATVPPPPVFRAPLQPVLSGERFLYEPAPQATGVAPLIRPEQVQTITDRFKTAYVNLNSPRVVIYINRVLTSPSKEANPPPQKPNPAFNLNDPQTLREIEQIFGHPLRQAGVTLVALDAATPLAGLERSAGVGLRQSTEASRKALAALATVADVVVEVLLDARNVTVASASGNLVYTVPDIQATAIRASDAKVLGQSSTADIIGKNPTSAMVQTYGPRPITEATVLALMDNVAVAALK